MNATSWQDSFHFVSGQAGSDEGGADMAEEEEQGEVAYQDG
jgi:hypothetical protein